MARITGSDADDTLVGTSDSDRIKGLGGDDVLTGWQGNDTLDGGSGADLMRGGQGDDVYVVDDPADRVVERPGGGVDTVMTSISWTLSANVENLSHTSQSDRWTGVGNELDNVISVLSSSNHDTIYGEGGNDTIVDDASATMVGGPGDDTYVIGRGSTIVEAPDEGRDTVRADLNNFTLPDNVENLVFVDQVFTIGTGNSLDNRMVGGSGTDVFNGLGGSDTLNGGHGVDFLTYEGAAAGVRVSLAVNGPQDTGGSGTDVVRHFEYLIGSSFADDLSGNHKNNFLRGDDGDDTLSGAGGRDTIEGGKGADVMTGGAGRDTFVQAELNESSVNHPDRITDLARGDTIDLGGIDANRFAYGQQAFVIVAAFDHHAGELTITYDAATGQTTIAGDVTGDAVADMRILLDGDHTDFTGFTL